MAVNTLDVRFRAYQWRSELGIAKKIALALAFAVVTGLVAQVRIPLPFTPVPITGQTFAALLAGVILGQWWGGASMLLYAGLGIAGVPWFNGWTGGISHLAGPTGGYVIGFILAALFMGYFTDKYVKARSFAGMFGLLLFANFVLIYVPGLAQLGLWLNLVEGKTVSIYQVLSLGFLPFVVGDIIKTAAAAGIAHAITPKQDYRKIH
jgi:biotin transport system substrate-specific component